MSPYQRALERLAHLLQKRAWSTDRLLYELSLPNIDLDAVAEHTREMLSRTFIEGFVHGNADADMARAALFQVVKAVGGFPLPATERELQQIVQLQSGFVFAEAHTNPDDSNHALELYFQNPRVGIVEDVKTALLGEMIREPCFNQLRTQEQLGYIVACRSRPLAATYPPSINAIAILIQSSFKDPSKLDAYAQKFVGDFLRNISASGASAKRENEAAFEAHKASLLAQIKEKEVSLAQESGRLWKEIVTRRYQWNRRELLEEQIKPLTHAHIVAFARELFEIRMHSLGVWIYGKDMEVPDDASLIPLEVKQQRSVIHSVNAFKRAPPPYFPLTVPKTTPAKASATAPEPRT